MILDELAEGLRASRGIGHKRDIAGAIAALAPALGVGVGDAAVPVGDDCAAIPDGDGFLLFAIEGFIEELVEKQPWFAGYCGVMVNVNDVFAMGGRPIAVVDAIWSRDLARARPVFEGMAAASRAYGVPIVGGHSNARSESEQLSVAILGRAVRLLTSFDAAPGDVLLAAIDLRGRYRDPYPYWDASTGTDPQRLQRDLATLPLIAEASLCRAGKDISMAGAIGTALMLLECSGLGARIDIRGYPAPPGVELSRWLLSTFPSFGFLLAVPPEWANAVIARFARREIPCAPVGVCDASGLVRLADGRREVPVWDFAREPLIGCGPRLAEAR